MPHSPLMAGRRLEQARIALLAVLAATLVSLSMAAGYRFQIHRESHARARAFIQVFKLETPALVPSGRSARNPGYTNPAVDLRPVPLPPIPSPEPEALLFSG